VRTPGVARRPVVRLGGVGKALTRQAKVLLLEKGVPEDALKAAAYWRADGTADDE
jgi:NADPH-dependent ferric siderophore reductase